MKQVFRIIVLSLLAMIYCATVVVAIDTSVSHRYTSTVAFQGDQGVITTPTIEYASYLTRPQNLVVPAQSAESLQYKRDFSAYVVYKQVIQQHISCKYVQYSLVSKSFLVHYRKTDGIFPFHYFW